MTDTLLDSRNLAFELYEVLNAEELTQRERFADHNRETFDAALLEAAPGILEAGLDKGVNSRLDVGDQHRAAIDVFRFVLVALAVVRGKEFFGDLSGSGQRSVEGFAVVISEALALGQFFGIQHFVQLEGQIA